MIQISELYEIYKKHPVVCTDTRKIEADVLFFALKGENFDAHTFTHEALEKGASFVVIDNKDFYIDERTILVNNVLQSLQALARHHRLQWTFPVIGLTGTNGKTTTKELINNVLKQKYRTYATAGNLNNHIGVPLTLLATPQNCEIAIIEMGANHPYEIEFLCAIAQPTHGLITNVGKAHLEGFGGFEGVIKTKGELYEWLNANKGTVFIEGNNIYLNEMRQKLLRNAKEIIKYGHQDTFQITGKITHNEPFLAIEWQKDKNTHFVQTRLTGTYNFENILAAICIGDHFHLSPEEINKGLIQYQPSNNRSQIVQKQSNTLICDYYNANPSSMLVALENLASFHSKRRVAFLGDMFELGADSSKEHLQVIQKAESEAIDDVILIGKAFFEMQSQFTAFKFFETTTQAFIYFQSQPAFENAAILIKGSRSMKMEQLLDIF